MTLKEGLLVVISDYFENMFYPETRNYSDTRTEYRIPLISSGIWSCDLEASTRGLDQVTGSSKYGRHLATDEIR